MSYNSGAGDEDQQNMQFSADRDFEGGVWIDGEFYYDKQREGRTQSKEEAIYGVFSRDSDRRPPRQIARPGAPYSAPMNFVSGGVKGGNIKPKAEVAASTVSQGAKKEETPVADNQGFRAKLGLGSKTKAKRKSHFGDDPDDEPKRGGLGAGAGIGASAAKKKPKPIRLDKGFGEFEKHTKGFGMKMMLKMGFKGRLGKKEQGIVNPIQAKLRPKGLGIGGGGFKEKSDSQLADEAFEKQLEEKESGGGKKKAQAPRKENWKKSKPKPKKVYKTAAQVTEETTGRAAQAPNIIVDMRGPHVKVTSLDQISSTVPSYTEEPENESLPELQHNLRILVEMTESDIHKLGQSLNHAKDMLVNVTHERDLAEKTVQREERDIAAMDEVCDMLDRCQVRLDEVKRSKEGDTVVGRLEVVARVFEVLHHKYSSQTRAHDLDTLAVAWGWPLFKALLHTWHPLQQPQHQKQQKQQKQQHPIMDVLRRWKMLFHSNSLSSQDVYSRLLREIVVPKIRLVVSSQWQVRTFEPVVQMLESIKPLLPTGLLDVLTRQCVVPALKRAVDSWNPRNDRVPIQTWIHPWLNLISPAAMEPVYAQVRYKFGLVLQDWHPSDASAFSVIAPWHKVWKQRDFESFIGRTILPRLVGALREQFVVNPHQQRLEPFQWVICWQPVMPTSAVVHLLATEFFPKWFHGLHTWLSAQPDFEEVSRWYLGWKEAFPPEIRQAPQIKVMFNQGLDLMNQAMEGKPLEPVVQQIMASLHSFAAAPASGAQPMAAARDRKPKQQQQHGADDDHEMSFKEIIEQFAAINSIPFLPNSKRAPVDGKRVFLFGKVNVYLDNGAIYANVMEKDSRAWRPISLQDLLALARS